MKVAFTPRTFARTITMHSNANAGFEFAQFLNGTTLADPADTVLEQASRFVWRNGDEIEATVNAYTRRLVSLRDRYGTIDQYDLEGSSRAMAAFALTAMMDGKGLGWATWYLRPWHTHILEAIRKHGMSLIRSDDVQAWNDLPETFTIYRGALFAGEKRMVKGTSWTIDLEIARRFGLNSIYSSEGKYQDNIGAVYKISVSKSDILYYSNERCEQEIILSPEPRGREADLHEKVREVDFPESIFKEAPSWMKDIISVPYSNSNPELEP